MLVRLYQKTVFCWDERSNSSIHGKTIISFPIEIAKINTKFVPQVNDSIEINDENYIVQQVKRHFGRRKNEKVFIDAYVDIYAKSKVYNIGYTAYLKKFTHVYDKYKDDSDPTKDLSKVNEKVLLPATLEEWTEIYNKLNPNK